MTNNHEKNFILEIKDTYLTIAGPSEGLYKEKGSKFIARCYPVQSEDDTKAILQELKKEFYNARHHCYAYRIGVDNPEYRINDDGEPSGTAGRPIYGQILSNDLTNIFIVVIRYFGGTKLGVSGLINAYKSAAAYAIEDNRIIEKTLSDTLELVFGYGHMNLVMRIIKEEGLDIKSQAFTQDCSITINVRKKETERIKQRFRNIYGIEVR